MLFLFRDRSLIYGGRVSETVYDHESKVGIIRE